MDLGTLGFPSRFKGNQPDLERGGAAGGGGVNLTSLDSPLMHVSKSICTAACSLTQKKLFCKLFGHESAARPMIQQADLKISRALPDLFQV